MLYRFPGVLSFDDNVYAEKLFCGRDEEGYKLLQCILAENLTVLFASSGHGKTSILKAYVFRKLREYGFYPVIVRFNLAGQSPQEIIKETFREINRVGGYEFNEQKNQGALKHFFESIEIWSQDVKLLTPVIVFDQFEEIFTLDHNSEYRQSFFREIAELLNKSREGRISIKIVFSIREDMLGKLERMSHIMPFILTNRFLLKPLIYFFLPFQHLHFYKI